MSNTITEMEGRHSFDDVDESTIPVSIFLSQEHPETSETADRWWLTADMYHPRKATVEENFFGESADNPEILQRRVREKVLPLYAAAFGTIQDIADGKKNYLHYWDK